MIDNVLIRLFPSYLADCGNETFWIPFSPRFDRLKGKEYIYYIMASFEIIFLFLSLISMILLMRVFFRHQIVHLNLTTMLLFHGLLYCVNVLLRLFQIAFETRSIYLPEPGCFPIPLLAVIRASAYVSIVLMMLGTIVERALATHFVIDYEKKKRIWISVSILFINYTASVMLSSQVIRGAINGIFLGIAFLVPVFASIIMFRFLLHLNQRRLARLNDLIERQRTKISVISRGPEDQYSLSLRLQLRENIWTMHKLFRMSLFAVPLCLLVLPLLALPPFFIHEKNQWWKLELINEGNNVALAAIAPLFTGFVAYVFKSVRKHLLPKRWQRRAKEGKIPLTVTMTVSEADQHFDQMNSLFQKSLELRQR